MLRAGFIGVVDAGGFGVEGVVRAAAELGIRAAIGPSLATSAGSWNPPRFGVTIFRSSAECA